MRARLSLSILDFQHPAHALSLACAADQWGYRRYWLGEHHTSSQCANPLLLGALLAGTTERIRIGTGGVSMTYHSPLRVAEDARLIELMVPGRFDIGITRGLTAEGPVAAALLDGRSAAGIAYEDRVRTLHGLMTGRLALDHPLAAAGSPLGDGPPLWLLGLSTVSARLAGNLGLGFCFSMHHCGPQSNGVAVGRRYRDSFNPSPEFPEPAMIVVVRCICATSLKEARAIERDLASHFDPWSETVIGSPSECAERLFQIAHDFSTEEIMLIDFLQRNQSVRAEMYRILADELGLAGTEGL